MELNDCKSYVTHFEFLSQLQKRQRKKSVNGAQTEIDERSRYFALMLQKVSIHFYLRLRRTLEKNL